MGIGGGGMGPLARLLARQGHRVTGSDQSELTDVKRFEECGIRVQRCHSVGNIADAELLIRSAAVPEDNPEVGAALASTVPVLKYSEALGRLMQ
ncbi:MAG: Mur ligase domain-containing protein, partial [Planctomycetota bacterium]|nr:Mur ligase domain-containing protein [Planctomycetota bacterium]